MCHAGWESRWLNRVERRGDRVSLRRALEAWRHGADFALDDLTKPTRGRFWQRHCDEPNSI
jgi:hypothetical protein